MKHTLFFFFLLIQITCFSQASLVKDVRSGAASSQLARLTNVSGLLFFTADDGATGSELYKSNGTTTSTSRVKDIYPGATSSAPEELVSFNGVCIFSAQDPVYGRELWKSDGTTAGTVLIKDIIAGVGSASPENITVVGSTIYFSVPGQTSVSGLWKTDGTAAGTVLVRRFSDGTNMRSFRKLNSEICFVVMGSTGYQLWKSNGTSAGTVVVKTFANDLFYMKEFKGKLYFCNSADFLLWVSDGTSAGTYLLKNIEVWGTEFVGVGAYLYFVAYNSQYGRELWRSDGTAAGTTLVKDINTAGDGFTWYYENGLIASNNMLFFVGINSTGERTLYKSNGTASGTVRIANAPTFEESENIKIQATSSLVYFAQGNSLWISNGTETGTVKIRDFTAPITQMGRVYTILYFNGATATNGSELWKYVPQAATARLEGQVNDDNGINNLAIIYPTLFKNSTHLKVSGDNGDVPMAAKIIGLNGKTFSSFAIKPNEEIELGSELPAGMYVVQLTTKNNEVVSKVIIKE